MALDAFDPPALVAELRSALPTLLPVWLGSQRWFADKARQVTGVTFDALCFEPASTEQLVLSIARVSFGEGPDARYFVPLAVVRTDAAGEPLYVLNQREPSLAVCEAATRPAFGRWLLERMISVDKDEAGRWEFEAETPSRETLKLAMAIPTRSLGAEQSNTSLRFGDIAMAKVIRRLQPAPNPDEEVLQVLGQLRFDHVPKLLGSVAWRAPDGARFPVVLVQSFVANHGDGWTWMLERLADIASGRLDPGAESLVEAARSLGRRTAEMHLALSQASSPDFAPEPTTEDVIEENRERVRRAAAGAVMVIVASQETHKARERMPALALAALESTADRRGQGFADELLTHRIRVHGDYHLGQVLRTVHDDWVIVDFEGEPVRPVAERREKTSVLKDVAGMLRSFSYAHGVAAKMAEEAGERHFGAPLRRWERATREAFLVAYRDNIRRSDRLFVPLDDAAFARALDAWEVDKTLYEIAYEAGNRPDWLWLPLSTLLPVADDQLADAAGAAPA